MKKYLLLIAIVSSTAFADECPDGYAILDDSGLCKIECAAGYYIATAGATCTKLTSRYHYIGAHMVIYGEVSEPIKCPTDGVTARHSDVYFCHKWVSDLRYTSTNSNCLAYNYSTHGTGSAYCYWRCDSFGVCGYDRLDNAGNPLECVGNHEIQTCDAGYYARIVANDDALQNTPCVPVGMGYYSPDGDLNRYACPENTVTCGRGTCAASVDDCVSYKTLHVGETEIKMPSRRYTTPSLVAQMPDGNLYYAQSSARDIAHGLKIRYNNQTYTILNAEDDFCPNGFDPNP
jgi:hypothetical protein